MSQFDTHGGYFAPKDYFKVNEGGTHEENPNGGVQVGMDPQGIPNMLEEGEPAYKDYVFSDNIIADKKILAEHNIPEKFAGMLYSKIADSYVDEAAERPNDPISREGLNAMLLRLADAQEAQKQQEEQRALEAELAEMSPEEIAALEQMMNGAGSQASGEPAGAHGVEGMTDPAMAQQVPVEQQAPMQQPMIPMACGGFIRRYAGGGEGDVVFDPERRMAYMPGYDNGTELDLYANLDPSRVVAYPGKTQAWVDAETSGIKKKIAEGSNQFLADAYEYYDHNPAAKIITGIAMAGATPTGYIVRGGRAGEAAVNAAMEAAYAQPIESAAAEGVRQAAKNTVKKGAKQLAKELWGSITSPFSVGSGVALGTLSELDTRSPEDRMPAPVIVGAEPQRDTTSTANTFDPATGFLRMGGQINTFARGGMPDVPPDDYYVAPGDLPRIGWRPGVGAVALNGTGLASPAAKYPDSNPPIFLTPYPQDSINDIATGLVGSYDTPTITPSVVTDSRVGEDTRPISFVAPRESTLGRYFGAGVSGALALDSAIRPPYQYIRSRYVPHLPYGDINPQNERYDPIDQNMIANSLIAQGNATARGLRNSGLGASSAIAQLAADRNLGQNLGTGFIQGWQANNQQRNAVLAANNQVEAQRAQFDYGVDAARKQALNQAALYNMQNDLMIQRLNNQERQNQFNAIGANLGNLAQAIAGMGVEAHRRNAINSNSTLNGYRAGIDGYNGYITAYGGKIKRR